MSYATTPGAAGAPYKFTNVHNNQNFRDIYELLERLCRSFVPPDNEYREYQLIVVKQQLIRGKKKASDPRKGHRSES